MPGTISPEADLRFQYDVIKGLADSVRQMATNMADLQKTQIDMLVRLARLEENKVGDELVHMKAATVALGLRVNALESVEDQRQGALNALGVLRVWAAPICGLLTVLYFAGRAMGVIPSPPVTVTKIEAPLTVERREHPTHLPAPQGDKP